jgi:hypothetical protein
MAKPDMLHLLQGIRSKVYHIQENIFVEPETMFNNLADLVTLCDAAIDAEINAPLTTPQPTEGRAPKEPHSGDES